MSAGDNRPPIVILLNSLQAGGSEKQVLLLSKGLAERGYRIILVQLAAVEPAARYASLLDEARKAGVEESSLLRILFTAKSGWLFWSWGYRAECIVKAFKLFRPSVRIWTSLRSASAKQIERRRWIHRLLASKTERIISNSQSAADLLKARMPDPVPVIVLPNIVETPFLQETSSRPAEGPLLTIAVVANIRFAVKGFDRLLEMAEELKRAGTHFQLHVAGEGPDVEKLRAEIAAHDLSEHFILHGHVDDINYFLRQHHLFVLASRVEGFPNALVEAMAAGIPCISTAVGDVVPLFEASRSVLVCHEATGSSLARAVLDLHTNPQRAAELTANARAYVKDTLTPTAVLEKLTCELEGFS